MTATAELTGAPGDPVSLARLRRWGGPKLVREMAGLFATVVPARIAEARQGLAAADAATVERAAHSIHSSTAQLGAVRMRSLSSEAERCAARGELEPIATLLDTLEREFASFTSWLEHTLDADPEARP